MNLANSTSSSTATDAPVSSTSSPQLANSIIVFVVVAVTFGLFYYLLIMYRRAHHRRMGLQTDPNEIVVAPTAPSGSEMQRRDSTSTLPVYSPEYQKVEVVAVPPVYGETAHGSAARLL
jgi:hypothetical protein